MLIDHFQLVYPPPAPAYFLIFLLVLSSVLLLICSNLLFCTSHYSSLLQFLQNQGFIVSITNDNDIQAGIFLLILHPWSPEKGF